MDVLKSLNEANEVSAVRLVNKRQTAKVGDIFRLSPFSGVFLWGRLIKRSRFFGLDALFNLIYIYDAFGPERPRPELLSPSNLILGPSVVNNLGWARGYWEIVASEPILPIHVLDQHLFVRFRGTGSHLTTTSLKKTARSPRPDTLIFAVSPNQDLGISTY